MRFLTPDDLDGLTSYIDRFVELVGRDRWFRRADHLDNEQRKSPFRRKIVSDYHWLELAISHQADVLRRHGRLQPELTDELALASLNFAATTVEVHNHLTPRGKKILEGRLRDALKADTGFAPVYLEMDLAQRLVDGGFDVEFVDIEGVGQFDLMFSRASFQGEVECKSLSADAGRQVHRKDFYRFIEALLPALTAHLGSKRPEVLVITLDGRLSPNTFDQALLRDATCQILKAGALTTLRGAGFEIKRKPYQEVLAGVPLEDPKAFYRACSAIFGHNTHVAGGLTEDGGCLIVMRSRREDDTSKPMLEAMRKAASQFSRRHPAFIAIQEHGIEAADLMLPHVRRRAAILSYALFGHYGATHVNATYVTGFGAVVARDGRLGTPAFAIQNRDPAFRLRPEDASPFLMPISDADYADAIGAPLSAPSISNLPIDLHQDQDAQSHDGSP